MGTPTFRMDQGEGLRISAIDPARRSTPPFDDFSSGVVTMRLRGRDGSTIVTVTEPHASLDEPGADGKIRGAGAYVPKSLAAGVYYGELEVDMPSGSDDWPQRWAFALQVRARAATGGV